MLGAAGLTTGALQTVSVGMVMVELTGGSVSILSLTVSGVAAYATSQALTHDLFSDILRRRRLPYVFRLQERTRGGAGAWRPYGKNSRRSWQKARISWPFQDCARMVNLFQNQTGKSQGGFEGRGRLAGAEPAHRPSTVDQASRKCNSASHDWAACPSAYPSGRARRLQPAL